MQPSNSESMFATRAAFHAPMLALKAVAPAYTPFARRIGSVSIGPGGLRRHYTPPAVTGPCVLSLRPGERKGAAPPGAIYAS